MPVSTHRVGYQLNAIVRAAALSARLHTRLVAGTRDRLKNANSADLPFSATRAPFFTVQRALHSPHRQLHAHVHSYWGGECAHSANTRMCSRCPSDASHARTPASTARCGPHRTRETIYVMLSRSRVFEAEKVRYRARRGCGCACLRLRSTRPQLAPCSTLRRRISRQASI